MKPYLEAGEFVATHGIAGELRLYPWCDTPGFLSSFKTLYLDEGGKSALEILDIRPHKSLCIVKLKGINTLEAARAYIGETAYIARAEAPLPEGRYFVQDLLGATVADAETGEAYGVIQAITRPGRHDVYKITRPDGATVLFPAAPPFIQDIDAAAGRVTVRPIPGMFTEARPQAAGSNDDSN
jgi:16S rRNA processing protein RimM